MTCNAPPPRRGSSARAAQILLIGWVLGFAVSVATAIAALTADNSDGSSSSDAPSAALAGYLLLLALALLAAVVSMRASRRRLGLHGVDLGLRATPRRGGVLARLAVIYVGLLAAVIEATMTVLDWCGVSSSGVAAGVSQAPGALPVETVHAALAGLVEEPVLLALPIALGRRCRWPWQVTLTVMIAMRISFHLYLGWDCLFVVPWIIGAFVLYRWCSLLWPFVIGHGLFDLLQTWQTHGGHAALTADALLIAETLAAAGITGVVVCRRAGLFVSPGSVTAAGPCHQRTGKQKRAERDVRTSVGARHNQQHHSDVSHSSIRRAVWPAAGATSRVVAVILLSARKLTAPTGADRCRCHVDAIHPRDAGRVQRGGVGECRTVNFE